VRRLGITSVSIFVLVLWTLPAMAVATAADLTLWTASSQPYTGSAMAPLPGDWVVDSTGTTVVQGNNGAPTFFASPDAVDGYRITADFATPTNDDDFFGIALGFTNPPGDLASDYLLIDWKQGDQPIDWIDGTGPSTGLAGLAVSRVTGSPTFNEFWGHFDDSANPYGGLEELQRGATLGATGWSDGTTYEFVLEYTTTSLKVWVDDSLELSLSGDLPPGPMALYDFSQPGLSVSGVTVELLNDPPAVLDGGADDVNVNEGQVGFTAGGFSDPDGDPLALSCSGQCTGFADNGDGTWTWSQLLVEGPDSFSVTVSASDGLLQTDDEFQVNVSNLAPVITSTSSVASSLPLGADVAVAADFTDAGILDTHTARFYWGDGTSSTAAITEVGGSGTATADHQYDDPGFYTITVTVWDDDGDSDSAVLGEVFAFDPDNFVTGGGWVSSPAGAVVADPQSSGKGTFGFVARYDRTGRVKGNVEFQVHQDLNFHALAIDYLLIDHGIAIFEGSGKVNGDSGFRFRIVATDERYASSTGQDLFWITITNGGAVVYDGSVYPPAGLPVKGRGIQIHGR